MFRTPTRVLAGAIAGATGALAGLGVVALTAGTIFAQTPPPAPPPQGVPTHQQMDQMMDAMPGDGTSQRMHDAMGPNGEQIMDQCINMMSMMQSMGGMSGGGGMDSSGMGGGMMGGGGQS